MRLGVVMPIASVTSRLLPRNWITAVTPDKEIWPHHTPTPVDVDYLAWNNGKEILRWGVADIQTPPRLRDIRSICVISASYYPFIGL